MLLEEMSCKLLKKVFAIFSKVLPNYIPLLEASDLSPCIEHITFFPATLSALHFLEHNLCDCRVLTARERLIFKR